MREKTQKASESASSKVKSHDKSKQRALFTLSYRPGKRIAWSCFAELESTGQILYRNDWQARGGERPPRPRLCLLAGQRQSRTKSLSLPTKTWPCGDSWQAVAGSASFYLVLFAVTAAGIELALNGPRFPPGAVRLAPQHGLRAVMPLLSNLTRQQQIIESWERRKNSSPRLPTVPDHLSSSRTVRMLSTSSSPFSAPSTASMASAKS